MRRLIYRNKKAGLLDLLFYRFRYFLLLEELDLLLFFLVDVVVAFVVVSALGAGFSMSTSSTVKIKAE